MDNLLKTKEKTPREGLTPSPGKDKTKTFLIGKELKRTNLRHTAERQASGSPQKPESKPPDSLHREASQAAGAAPTLRYGPAGDSAPWPAAPRSAVALASPTPPTPPRDSAPGAADGAPANNVTAAPSGSPARRQQMPA